MFEKKAPRKPGSGGFEEETSTEYASITASGKMFARSEQQAGPAAYQPLVKAPVGAPDGFQFHVEIKSYTDYDFAVGSIYQRVTDLGNFNSLAEVNISAAIKQLQNYVIPEDIEPHIRASIDAVDDVFMVEVTLVAVVPHIGMDIVG